MKFASAALFALGLGLMAAPVQAETIKIGLQPWLGYGPLWIAEKQGFFKEQGVDVQLVNFSWDADLAAALASGNINVTSIATNGLILQRNNGIDLKAFMLMDGSTTADAVLSNKSVNSITELKGKKVAYELGATSDLLINYALKVNGMSLKDIEAVPINASDAGLALIAGRVDVAVTYEPYISAALAQGPDFKILFSAGEKPGLISDILAAQSDFLAAHPTELQGIIKAWDQAVTYLRANPDEGGKIIADAVGSPIDEFKTAFAGVQLFDIKENLAELDGDFQATVGEIGALMQEAKPDEIKTIPTGDEILDLTALKGLAQ
ncbi:ABC transporter substrate-binding protein [Devosia sp.]|uniref:ABC transporter substrate-binding protein n=1 Tax=Devosia sp. TaxID=1871048 RepID=UPI003BA9EA45